MRYVLGVTSVGNTSSKHLFVLCSRQWKEGRLAGVLMGVWMGFGGTTEEDGQGDLAGMSGQGRGSLAVNREDAKGR